MEEALTHHIDSPNLLGMIRYYTDHLLNEEDPERTAGYHLAQCVNEFLELGIEEIWDL